MSMLDDPGVVAGLEGLEPAQPRGSAASDPAFHASMQNLDSGLPDLSSEFDIDALPQFAPESPEFAAGPSVAFRGLGILRIGRRGCSHGGVPCRSLPLGLAVERRRDGAVAMKRDC